MDKSCLSALSIMASSLNRLDCARLPRGRWIVYLFDWPCLAGLVYTPGASQVASVSFT